MYYIYRLIDPRDNKTYYIGKTKQPNIRLYEHIYYARNAGKTPRSRRNEWLMGLHQAGLKPIMETIEIVDSADVATATETYWIDTGINQGWPLTNNHRTSAKYMELVENDLTD